MDTVDNVNGSRGRIGGGGQTGVVARMNRLQVGDPQTTGQRRRVDVVVEINANPRRRSPGTVVDNAQAVVPEDGRILHRLVHQTRQTQRAPLFDVHLGRTHHLRPRFCCRSSKIYD